MKEILYIQAGSLANYIGTHYWNTQESYFTYDEDSDPIVNHDISFREGSTPKREPTFCPRLIVFDRKTNFGTLSQSNALFNEADGDADSEEGPSLWDGNTVEFRQDPIAKSPYQERIEDDLENELFQASDSEIKHWSDFNRVYYIPRTIQRLPDSAESVNGDWNSGKELFTRYNEEMNLMDESVRLFVEECDLLQGIQIINDTTSFGSFIDSFLSSFRDEYLKLPSITFPLLSNAIPGRINLDDAWGLRDAVNDALCLRSLDEFSTMNIPIQSPSTWEDDLTGHDLTFNRRNLYHTSSIISVHIETVTFPLRLKKSPDDFSSYCAQLDWRGSTHFGQLNGAFPVTSPLDFHEDLCEFSVGQTERRATQFARRDVSRGFSHTAVQSYEDWCARSPLREPFLSSIHAPAYPLPSSFPSIFNSAAVGSTASTNRKGVFATPSTSMFSSVSTGTSVSALFERYACFIEDCLKRKSDVMVGVEKDELKDLGNDLWVLRDRFAEGDSGE